MSKEPEDKKDVEMDEEEVIDNGRVAGASDDSDAEVEAAVQSTSDKAKEDNEEDDNAKGGGDGEEEEATYEVEKILNHRKKGRRTEYYVSWVGYGKNEDCWITEQDADGCEELINEYWNRMERENKKSVSPAGRRKRTSIGEPVEINDEDEDEAEQPKKKRFAGKSTKVTNNVRNPRTTSRASPLLPKNGREIREIPWDVENWDDLIKEVETIERDDKGDLTVYLTWNNGSKTALRNSAVRTRVPQRLLDFYELHLRFRNSDEVEADEQAHSEAPIKREAAGTANESSNETSKDTDMSNGASNTAAPLEGLA